MAIGHDENVKRFSKYIADFLSSRRYKQPGDDQHKFICINLFSDRHYLVHKERS